MYMQIFDFRLDSPIITPILIALFIIGLHKLSAPEGHEQSMEEWVVGLDDLAGCRLLAVLSDELDYFGEVAAWNDYWCVVDQQSGVHA